MLEQKLQQFGIPLAAMKTRPVPRVLTAYDGPDKAEFLCSIFAMICNGVLPAHGWRRSVLREYTQDELAAAMGIQSRATVTRRFSRLRGEATDKMGNRKGNNLAVPLLQSKRVRFAGPNIYSILVPEKKGIEWIIFSKSTGKAIPKERFTGADATQTNLEAISRAKVLDDELGYHDHEVRPHYLKQKNFYYPSAREIVADPRLAPMFDKALLFNQDGKANFAGSADTPEWLWHPNLGISDTARLVFNYYVQCGLLSDRDKATGRLKGCIQPRQSTVAKRCGISTKTVRRANSELESIGLIRVVGTESEWQGEKRRSFNKILFLPIRTMTDKEIEAERFRRAAARKALHEVRKIRRRQLRQFQLDEAQQKAMAQNCFNLALACCKATRIHRQVVVSYKDQKIRIGAIWEAAKAKLLEAGVDRRIISALIPNILAPPSHPPGDPPDDDKIRKIIQGSLTKAIV